ncbi:MAG: hypothetical protein U0Z26_19755, partial [Anaerolineales bacterium]
NLYTIGITAPQKVTMSGTNTFNNNGNSGTESGLVVSSDGTITLNSVTANHNFFDGVNLNNYTNWSTRLPSPFATFGSVSVTGFGNFASNGNEGLYISTKGSVSITNISASSNLNNDGVGINAYGNVTLTCVATYNNAYGFYMYHQTPLLTIKGLSSAGNVNSNEFLSYAAISRTRCP